MEEEEDKEVDNEEDEEKDKDIKIVKTRKVNEQMRTKVYLEVQTEDRQVKKRNKEEEEILQTAPPTVFIKPRIMEIQSDQRQEQDICKLEKGELGGDVDESLVKSEVEKTKLHLTKRLWGPKPAKIALFSVVIISVWITWILLIHISLQISLLSESMRDMRGDINSMEENLQENRHRTQQLYKKISESSNKGHHSIDALESNKSVDTSFREEGPSKSPTLHPSPPLDQSLCTRSGEPCLLPFIHKGTLRNSCIQDFSLQIPWCAISVSPNREMINWSYCTDC